MVANDDPTPGEMTVRRFGPSLREDFFRLHSESNEAGWCRCVAWWVPSWEGWGDRKAEDNREVREGLLERGGYDGYLLFGGTVPIGWCQAGPRDRLEKLVRQFGLQPDTGAWAITCFLIAPRYRRLGLASRLLAGVLADLRERGARRVEAFPKRGQRLQAEDLWNGPEAMFLEAGFRVVRDDPNRHVLALELG